MSSIIKGITDENLLKTYGDQWGLGEGAPELLKAEMPLHRHAEKLLAQNGVSKDDPDYQKHLAGTIKHLRKFGNIDLINKQGVAEGSEQVYKVVAVDKSNALKSKPKKLKVKAGSMEEVFERLAASDWYPLEINGLEVIDGKRLKQGVAEGYQNDESNLWYKYDDSLGRVRQSMIHNTEERSARREGWREFPEDALRAAGIIRSKFDSKKWIKKVDGKWVQVYPFGKPEGVAEGKTPPIAGFNKKPHKVGPGTSKDDYEYKKFIPRDRKEKGEEWAIARDVRNVNSKLGAKKPSAPSNTGFYKNYLGNRPFREGSLSEALSQVFETHSTGTTIGSAGIGGGAGLGIEASPTTKILQNQIDEGEVVSLQARKIAKQYPIIFATAARSHGINDVDLIFKDLRTNKIVAHVVGNNYRPIEINGKELGGPSYEIRINPQGLKSEGGPVSYLAAGDPNHSKDKGKHRIFTLVPSEKKIEKSKGPGGTTKLRPDIGDVANYMVTSGTYYGYDLIPESDDDWYTFLEKELNGKIMDQDLAVELGYVYSMYNGDLVFLQQPQTISGEKITIPQEDWEKQDIESPYEPRTPNLQYFNLDDVKETIQSSQGGMGQAYRKVSVKGPAGMRETAIPMFAPEEKTKESSIMKGIQAEGETVTRKEWSKENPPPPELLLNTLIQILMNPNNKKTPEDLINLWNDRYGLKHTLRTLKTYAQNDYTKYELSKALTKAAMVNEKWSNKYKKSINCSNPKGFSQKAHCAGRKARRAGKHTKSSSVS